MFHQFRRLDFASQATYYLGFLILLWVVVLALAQQNRYHVYAHQISGYDAANQNSGR